MTQGNLFDMQETPSPRLLWMRQHGLAVMTLDAIHEPALSELREKFLLPEDADASWVCLPVHRVERFRALLAKEPKDDRYDWEDWAEKVATHLVDFGTGPTEAEACADYARMNRINHWSL